MTLLAIVILLVNVLMYFVLKRKMRYMLYLVVLLSVWLAYGFYRINSIQLSRQPANIYVMQPSIPQEDKWDEEHYQQILSRYRDLVAEAKEMDAGMLIFPEAAMPVYVMLTPRHQIELQEMMEMGNLDIFAGFPHCNIAPEDHAEPYYYYNAATLFQKDGSIMPLYYKNILVPVAERMLWMETFPFLWRLQLGQANWEFGTRINRYQHEGLEFSPSICYELAFAHFMARAIHFAEDGSYNKADFHVNITNDAWFGTSYGPWLHGVMTKFRAVESRIQIYRSANTGISMIVDPIGRVLDSASLFEVKNITSDLYKTDIKPIYIRIVYYPWLIVALTLILLVVSFVTSRRGK